MGRTVGNAAPSTGEGLKWNGSQWVPDADNEGTGGSGDIEAVTAGMGLTGGGHSGEVTINAQNGEPIWNANQ